MTGFLIRKGFLAMLTDKILQQIKNVEIEVESYEANSRALHTQQEETQRRESLLRNGLINPIIITESENNEPLIVDGNLRYKIIRELKEDKKWITFPINIHEIPLEQAKNYRDIQTNHKNYSKIQLAVYAAYNYWDEVEQASLQRQQSGTTANEKKGKTSKIVGNMGSVSEKYAEYAHKLLEIDREFFYEIFFIHRFSVKKDEILRLIDINSNDSGFAKKIVHEMKSIFDGEKNNHTDTERKSIFTEALVAAMNTNKENTTDYENIDIAKITKTPSTKPKQKKSKIEYEKQHDKNAQKILQEDVKIQTTLKEEILPIGISFQSEISEDKLEGILNTLRISRFNPILINSLQDFENFQNGEEENL